MKLSNSRKRIHKSLLIDMIYKLKSYIIINDWIYWKGRVIIHLQDIIVNGFTTIFPSKKSFESACSKDFLFCRKHGGISEWPQNSPFRYISSERRMFPSKSVSPPFRHHSNTFPITIIRISVAISSRLTAGDTTPASMALRR